MSNSWQQQQQEFANRQSIQGSYLESQRWRRQLTGGGGSGNVPAVDRGRRSIRRVIVALWLLGVASIAAIVAVFGNEQRDGSENLSAVGRLGAGVIALVLVVLALRTARRRKA